MNRSSRFYMTALLGAMMISSLASTASAQGNFNRKLFGAIPADTLLRLEDVQKAVEITDEQKKAIETMAGERRDEQQAMFQDNQGDFDAIRGLQVKMNTKFWGKMIEALEDKQDKRIQEIYLQVNGGVTFADEAIAKLLKITDEQKTKITEALDESRQDVFGSFQDFQNMEEDERTKAQDEMVSDRENALMEILTSEQKEELKKAKGEVLEVDLSKLPGFGE